MRLIDADAYLKKVCTYKETGCGSCRLQTICPVDEPTVEAIPVEWIEEWLDDFLGTKIEEEIDELDEFHKDVYRGILLMYNEWRREK